MLRYFFVIVALCFSFSLKAQFTDNFSDGDFNTNPTWNGNIGKFKINTGYQLQLDTSGTGSAQLLVSNTAMDSIEWLFWIKLSFSPSDNNYAAVYLVSDNANLDALLNGYFIRIGENGSSDGIDLWKQTGTSKVKIIDGISGHAAKPSNTLRIKVIRDNSGNWSLYADTLGGHIFRQEGNVFDKDVTATAWFGIQCKYTSSNANKFFFDDVYVGEVIQDTIAPTINKLSRISDKKLDVYFTEEVELTSSQNTGNYLVDNGIGEPVFATRDNDNLSLVHLSFSKSFVNGAEHHLEISKIKDDTGNARISDTGSFFFYIMQAQDVVINEILYDPKSGGAEFVEIINRSAFPIELKELKICSQDTQSNALKDIYPINDTELFIYPKQYLVLSPNAAVVKSQYDCANPKNFIQMAIPSLNNEGDIVVLADTVGNIIDKVIYYPSMHFPLLNSTKGVSLERIDFNRNSLDKTNWQSAAENVGFATPTYQNSQFLQAKGSGEVSISPESFSPDNDGYNDVLTISYQFEKSGVVGSITIYDMQGIPVKKIIRNEWLASKGSFSWNGMDEQQEKACIGIYIVYFETFDVTGATKTYKKACVLAGKL